MHSTELTRRLGSPLDSFGENFFASLGTVARPSLDDDDDRHYDWVLVKKLGIELGFADAAYFAGQDEDTWGTQGLRFVQVTFYSDTRPGVRPYTGELPWGLSMDDSKTAARHKLSAYESTLRSYQTDCWEVGRYRVVLAYRSDGKGLDSVHIKLPEPPLPQSGELQPQVTPEAWLKLFGLPATSPELNVALAPLNVPARIEEHDDEREVDFIDECGISLYFEKAKRLRTARGPNTRKQLVFGAVKFYRARDLGARQFSGELPVGLHFSDSPQTLLQRLQSKPAKHTDGRLTGRALWHFENFSLQVLYSTVENHLFRVVLMAPGYWQELDDLD